MGTPLVLWFTEVGMSDVPRVGGKNASLGELITALTDSGVRVPDGFATTADAYRAVVAHNQLEPRIRSELEAYRAGTSTLQAAGEAIREAFLAAELPAQLTDQLRTASRERHGAGTRTSPWRSAAARRRKICPMRVSPDSRRRS